MALDVYAVLARSLAQFQSSAGEKVGEEVFCTQDRSINRKGILALSKTVLQVRGWVFCHYQNGSEMQKPQKDLGIQWYANLHELLDWFVLPICKPGPIPLLVSRDSSGARTQLCQLALGFNAVMLVELDLNAGQKVSQD